MATIRGLLTADDLAAFQEEAADAGEELRWATLTVRVLVPAGAESRDWLDLAYHVDQQASGWHGRPIPCPNRCGHAAISTFGFPHGYDHYCLDAVGKTPTVQPGIYCPHCDGSEDN